MIKNEKKLLWIFLAILAIGIIVQGIPFAAKSYQSGIAAIEESKEKINRLKKLQDREEYWQAEFNKINEQEQQLLKQLFVGHSAELIAARVQEKIKVLARQSGIKVDSMNLPDLKQTNKWLLISQTMTFKASTDKLMKLLKMIKQSKSTLIVTDVKMNAFRDTLNCTIKVVGFAHSVVKQGSDS
ncbi:MAG: type II secretion system protein M [gamma proteobacterium symbiont of Bathyaustriella thionipta]|nr:type II secretion system protein M [gamma proteobacterium symbiont of Bathyaustriella thionipta]MCU7950993.1 type II secretion system protein M [gamma proteobacterium symbiont of Bathyaustriella thionipta]MCU7953940.1 type II secretion system protein M [gamma proteobacterium symbiont of Bathyaustriella thionipta]MCU7957499.1 type II secretion system protein M [gamma proteobacterium symbiont of Bathyaustriella thionipta]MCU7966654.1 type II secretion system protein M [gamma proteobacterium sy